jgi:hypothetical protein
MQSRCVRWHPSNHHMRVSLTHQETAVVPSRSVDRSCSPRSRTTSGALIPLLREFKFSAEFVKLIKSCWDGDSHKRPTFPEIGVRKLQTDISHISCSGFWPSIIKECTCPLGCSPVRGGWTIIINHMLRNVQRFTSRECSVILRNISSLLIEEINRRN